MDKANTSGQPKGNLKTLIATDSTAGKIIVIEVLIVFGAVMGAMWLMEWMTAFEAWGLWTFFAGLCFGIIREKEVVFWPLLWFMVL